MTGKAQSAMEFVVLSSFMLLVIVGFFAITTSRMFEARDEIEMRTAQDIAEFTFREIEIASSVASGYTRVFSVPRTVNGVNYSISIIDNRELVISYLGHEYIKFLPSNVTGNITKGMNQIKRVDDVIMLQTVSPQCSNEVDDDGDGKIDAQDPGCYSSCNYLVSNNYVQDWAESDSCTCAHTGTTVCCAGIGINTSYALFDASCGIGQCWSGCLGARVLSLKGSQNGVYFLSDGSLILRGTLQQNAIPSETLANDLVIRNSTGQNVMVASEGGNMQISGAIFQNQGSLQQSSAYDRFMVKDDDETLVAYVDEAGNLYLKGNLTENDAEILDS